MILLPLCYKCSKFLTDLFSHVIVPPVLIRCGDPSFNRQQVAIVLEVCIPKRRPRLEQVPSVLIFQISQEIDKTKTLVFVDVPSGTTVFRI